jgi:hypothetical protein
MHAAAMDDHQRAMWYRMLDRIEGYRRGELSLARLVDDLHGLVVEADPHVPAIRDHFESIWQRLDGELELRTEPWAPPGAANDVALAGYLDDLQSWVATSVLSDPSDVHD